MTTVTTSTSSSTMTLNGVSTGIDTTALINAIIAQKGIGVTRLKAQQTLNNQKITTLSTMKGELSALTVSMAALQDSLSSRVVTSTDSGNSYVTATATSSASGSYDINVSTLATRGRLSAQLDSTGAPKNLAVANPSDSTKSPVFTGAPPTFAIQGTDGQVYQVTLDASSNTLNGLRDKINSVAGASVSASVVNTGKGTNHYQLVVTAKNTGTGTTGGVVSIADITNMNSDGTPGVTDPLNPTNTLGIAAGGVVKDATTGAISGLGSNTAGAVATDANFTLNGVSMTRGTNVVTDAADGFTFNLKQGGQQGITTLSVTQDTSGATTALQDFITKYNTLVKDYKTASNSTKNADGSIAEAPLANDPTTRTLMNNLRAAIAGGLPASSTYKHLSDLGVSVQADGTLYLNTNTFKQALNTDVASVQNLFSQGPGKTVSSLVSTFTGGGGGMANLVKLINTQNTNLVTQIAHGQSLLDDQAAALKTKFAQMEAIVGALKAATTTLSGS